MVKINEYIVADPKVLGGKPVIKGTRISVAFILQLLASGMSVEDILKGYPHLTKEAILAAIDYAADTIEHERILEVG